MSVVVLIIRRPPKSTRPDTCVPYTTLCRSTSSPVSTGPPCEVMPTLLCSTSIWPYRDRARSTTPRMSARQVTSACPPTASWPSAQRSEEHTSELQSLMRLSYAVFCLKKKKKTYYNKALDTHPLISTNY